MNYSTSLVRAYELIFTQLPAWGGYVPAQHSAQNVSSQKLNLQWWACICNRQSYVFIHLMERRTEKNIKRTEIKGIKIKITYACFEGVRRKTQSLFQSDIKPRHQSGRHLAVVGRSHPPPPGLHIYFSPQAPKKRCYFFSRRKMEVGRWKTFSTI